MSIKSLTVVTDPEVALKHRYEAIIDYMLTNPHMKQQEIALMIGCTGPWLSQIINSNGFQARYQIRRLELGKDQERSITARIFEMADKAADRVLSELDKGEECDANFALDASSRALRAIGFGAPQSGKGGLSLVGAGHAEVHGRDGEVSSETLRIAREAIAKQSVVMTRITERVEVSPSTGNQDSRDISHPANVYPNAEIDR
jgi:hypothetical protein